MKIFGQDWIFIPLFGIATFFLSWMWADKVFSWFHRRSLGSREYVLQKLDLMFVETDPKRVTIAMLLASFGLGALVFLAVWPNLFLGLIFASIVTVAGWSIPKAVVDYLYARRCSQFVDQMVDGLTMMANGVRSGLSIPQTMERVSESMPNPISQEFNLVLSQIRLGLGVEEALNGMATRIPNADVQMFVLAINILKETGGNLAETFSTIVETLRERQKIEKKIEALTAQGVTQGIILSSMPFLLMIVFFIIDPGFLSPMFSTTLGIVFLFIMLGLQITGGLVIRNIVKIKV